MWCIAVWCNMTRRDVILRESRQNNGELICNKRVNGKQTSGWWGQSNSTPRKKLYKDFKQKAQTRLTLAGYVQSTKNTIRHYTVLYCTVLYCTVLYCTVLYCTVLYCTALHCTELYWKEVTVVMTKRNSASLYVTSDNEHEKDNGSRGIADGLWRKLEIVSWNASHWWPERSVEKG